MSSYVTNNKTSISILLIADCYLYACVQILPCIH